MVSSRNNIHYETLLSNGNMLKMNLRYNNNEQGPLLFLLYVNDLPYSSVLEPIMFADDTNLYFEHTDLSILFFMVNDELKKN